MSFKNSDSQLPDIFCHLEYGPMKYIQSVQNNSWELTWPELEETYLLGRIFSVEGM